jgi:hypothetical protein
MVSVDNPAKSQDAWGKPADTGKAPKKPKVRLPLETTRDCAKALARLIRKALAGDMQTSDLSRYSNALMILSRIIEGGELADLSARLDAIEQNGGR